MTFVIPENATSTPTKASASAPQTKTLFGSSEPKPASTGLLGTGNAAPFGNANTFGSAGIGPSSFGQSTIAPKEPPKSAAVTPVTQRAEPSKPFITVEPNYAPPTQNAVAVK